uniref:Mitogen activated protein kinase, putative n=1 Tax=Leishmania donovani (strain BPK282A1) TaxID=981087 RepID=UPI0004AC215F|nr:Chain A, Mitogen activated protein kinase, putative [Leishmania donovani BPK282A1]4QNY_B Chain B, Mitogen activated protein kinase, putative [Leishmania donovani BPK282A1]
GMPATKSLAELQAEVCRLDDRYLLERIIGAGSYGVVIRARDTKSDNRLVAMKRVNKEIFEEVILAKRILREIKLLAHFNDDNIIGLRNILTPEDPENFDHFYIVMDIMETDLKQVLRSGQELTEAHIQFFIYQALRALHIIHSAGVIHRDITPANILVNTNCDLKICDFGLAKEENDQGEYMTDYVTMRWYRAPELVMEDKDYSAQIDVWGIGCILGELLGSRPLFQGKDRVNQLDKIVDVIGTPSEEDINSVGSSAAQKYLKKKSHRPQADWRQRYPTASPEALDLLRHMLVFNPKRRITVLQAMRHPFLEQLHDDADDNLSYALFRFDENEQKTIVDVKRAIYEESVKFHNE